MTTVLIILIFFACLILLKRFLPIGFIIAQFIFALVCAFAFHNEIAEFSTQEIVYIISWIFASISALTIKSKKGSKLNDKDLFI